ncbi:uncharacterized protein [Macrobrachium rosenbergii]|uniref:uncharacterized protein n=1 Tax=Macrobrachium rosenbergii TaxID=79674 RepID=UPI0034D3D696
MSSKKITYSSDFKLKVLDYYFKHGGDDKFGLKKKTAGHFNIDKKTINRMLNNPEMVKRARKLLTTKKTTASGKLPPTGSRPPVKPAVRKAGANPTRVSNTPNKSASSSQSSASSSSSNKVSTSSTTSTKSVSSSSRQQVSSTPSGSNKAPSQKPKSGIPEDKGSPGVEVFELPEDPDYSLLKRSINAATNGVGGLAKLLVTGTEEVRNVVLNECDVILECKVCRSLFRSVVNFLAHKRIYCQDEFADVRTLFHKGDVQGVTTQSSTVVVEPEPPPDGEDLNTMRTTIPTTYTSPIRSAQGKAKHSGIDSIALKLARKRKAYHASSSSSSSSTHTGSSSYYKSLGEVSRSRDKLSRDCSVMLEDIGGVTNAVFQSFIPPGSASPSMPMSSLIEEASNSKSGLTVAINQNGEIVKTASGEIMSMDVDQSSSHSDSKDLTCLLCNTRFATQKTLSVHQRSHHGFERCIYSCPICQASFLSMWAVVKHLQRTHKKTKNQIERLRKVVRKNVRKKIIYQKAEKDKESPVSTKDDNEDEEEEEDDDDEEDDEEKVEDSDSSPVKTNEIVTPKKSGIGGSVQISQVKGSSHKGWRSKDGVRWMCNVCRKMFITRVASLAHVATHIVCNFEPKAVLVNIQNEQELPESRDASTSEKLQEDAGSEVENSEVGDDSVNADEEDTDDEQETEGSDDSLPCVLENKTCRKVITKETVSKLKKKYFKIAVSSAKTTEELEPRESLRKRIRHCDSNSTITSLKSGKILVKEVSNKIGSPKKNQVTMSQSKTSDFKAGRNLKRFIESKECGKKTVLVKSMMKSGDGDSSLHEISSIKSTLKESRNMTQVTVTLEDAEKCRDVLDKRFDGKAVCDEMVESGSSLEEKTKTRESVTYVSEAHPENKISEILLNKSVVCPASDQNNCLDNNKLAIEPCGKYDGENFSFCSDEKVTEKKDLKKGMDGTASKNVGCSSTKIASDSIHIEKEASVDLFSPVKKESIDEKPSDLEKMCATDTVKGETVDSIDTTTETIKSENVDSNEALATVSTPGLKIKEESESVTEVKEEKIETEGSHAVGEHQTPVYNNSTGQVLEANTYSSTQKGQLKPKDIGVPSSGTHTVSKSTTLPKYSVTPTVSVSSTVGCSKNSVVLINTSIFEASSKSEILFTSPSSKVLLSKPGVSSHCDKSEASTFKPLYTVAPSAKTINSTDGVVSLSKTGKDVCHASSKPKIQKSTEMDSVSQESSDEKIVKPVAVATKVKKTPVCPPYHTFSGAQSPNTGALESPVSLGVSNLKTKGLNETAEVEKSEETLSVPKTSVSQPVSQVSTSAMLKSLASLYDSKANPRSTAVPKASSTYAAQLKKYADSPSENSSVGTIGAKLPNSEVKIKKDSRNPLVLALRKDGTVITLPRKSTDSTSPSMCATQSSTPKPEPVDPLVVAYRMTGTTIPIAAQKIATSTSAVKVKKFLNTKGDSANSESVEVHKMKSKLDQQSVEPSVTSLKTHSKAYGTYQSVHIPVDSKNKPILVQYGQANSLQDVTELKSHDTFTSPTRLIYQGSYKIGEKSAGEPSKSISGKTQSLDDKSKTLEQTLHSTPANKTVEKETTNSSLTNSPTTLTTSSKPETAAAKVVAGGASVSSSRGIPESSASLPTAVKRNDVLSKSVPSPMNLVQRKKCENVNLKSESTFMPGSASLTNSGEVSRHQPFEQSESQNTLEQKSQNSFPVIPGLIPSYKMKLQRSNEVGSLPFSVKKNYASNEKVGNESEKESMKFLGIEEPKKIQDADNQKDKSDIREKVELGMEKLAIKKSLEYSENVKNKGTLSSAGEKDTAIFLPSANVEIYEENLDPNPDFITSKGISKLEGNEKEKLESKQVYVTMKKSPLKDTEDPCGSSSSGDMKPDEIGEEGNLMSSFAAKPASVSSLKVNSKKEANKEVWKMVMKAQTSLKFQGKDHTSCMVSGHTSDGIYEGPISNAGKCAADIEENFGFLVDETSYSSHTESIVENVGSSSITYSPVMKRKADSADCHYKKRTRTESSDVFLSPKERKASSQPEIKDLSSSDPSFSEGNQERGCEGFSASPPAKPSSTLETLASYDLLKDVNMPKVMQSELDPLTTDADSTIDEAAVIQSHTTFGDLSYDYDLNE